MKSDYEAEALLRLKSQLKNIMPEMPTHEENSAIHSASTIFDNKALKKRIDISNKLISVYRLLINDKNVLSEMEALLQVVL